MVVAGEDASFPLEQSDTSKGEKCASEEHISLEELEELRCLLRKKLLDHLKVIGLVDDTACDLERYNSKDAIRAYHAVQRADFRIRHCKFVTQYGERLLHHFADGDEVEVDKVDPVLYPITKDGEDNALFRLSTLLWSIPVSPGYGRRMRFLVRDRSNGKLMGIFALADPVFNLHARDMWIGWTTDDRRQRLVNVMDAHVVGAVPPYSHLLGGKVVASLMTSQEVYDLFAAKYGESQGIISGKHKHAQLALVTVTSALGRSSLYNRLKLPGMMEFCRVGMTEGWGHFQVPDKLFLEMRRLLELEKHPYASNYHFGQGPNWRIRVIRLVLEKIGLDPNLLRHGIAREIYASPLAPQWREFLCGRDTLGPVCRPSATEIGQLAISRWMIPRANRIPDYRDWTRGDTWKLLSTGSSSDISDG